MTKSIEIKYSTPELYKSLKGFKLTYEFENGSMEAFEYLPKDAIILLPVLYKEDEQAEVYNTKRAVAKIAQFITSDKDVDKYSLQPFKMKQKATATPITIVETKPETPIKEEAIIMEKTIVNSTVPTTATPVTETITVPKTEEATTMTEVQMIAKEMGITPEQIKQAMSNLQQSEVAEALEFIAEESTDMEKEILSKTVADEDDEKLLQFMNIALGNLGKRSDKSVDVKAKAARFGKSIKENGIKLFGWAKEQGLKLLGFLWGSIQFIWKHASALIKATLGFGGDIISILFRHAGQILGEVSQSAQVRYAPVFGK